MAQDDSRYTEPELRARLKERLQASDKGGRKGQWSARKSQLLVQEYEKAGGGYTTDERGESQRHLEQWGEQDWQTRSGDADARGDSGTSRYLPELAWELLTPQEREATDRRKRSADEQHVANTDAAQEARKAAELVTLKAAEARTAVHGMDTRSQLERARTAEADHGRARTTVLRAIGERLQAVED